MKCLSGTNAQAYLALSLTDEEKGCLALALSFKCQTFFFNTIRAKISIGHRQVLISFSYSG
jgi:hypothetical protein